MLLIQLTIGNSLDDREPDLNSGSSRECLKRLLC
jgi:hypothetical protein